VGLAVVLRPGSGLDEAALIDAVKPHLAAFKQPRRIAVLPELPRLGSGKIDKLSLQAAQSETNLGPAHQTRTGLAAQVAPLWSAALQGPDPRDEDDFFDAGGDSLTAAEFLLALEAELGRTVTQTMLYDAPRFGAFVAALEAGVEGASASAPPAQERILQHVRQTTLGWPGRPSGAQGLLYGLHLLADGPPLFYCSQGENEGIIAMVGPSRPLYIMRTLFELPGRTPDETAELARLYAEDIMALQPDGPVHLAGFCEGGRLFEITARHLRAAGREIALFVSIDHWFNAPSPYPVLHAFTERRRMSPVRRFVRYERAFPYLHPGGVAQVRLKGDHADALTRHGLAPLKAALADAMAGAVPPKLPDPQGLPLARRAEQHKAAISIRAPGVLSRTAPRSVVVDVTNTSGAPWEPFETSGLALGVHFNNLDGFRRVPHALHLPLTTRVAPGQRHRFEVEIRYPDTGLPLYLTAQMIDEGFAEFGGPHRYGARRLVWANPLTARTWRD
ncbi:MAG: phosphopantetheine-binding protein, partial [Pseudomonadota bacterium]